MTHFSIKEHIFQTLMFLLTLIFLSLASLLIEYLQTEKAFSQLPYSENMIEILLILWPVFFIERLLYLIFCQERTWKSYFGALLIVLFPPLRFAARRCDRKRYLWWNFTWQEINVQLCDRLEKRFMFPILIISLLMLPFWIVDFFFPQKIVSHLLFYHALSIGNALIWALFVIEFTLMFSITPKRLKYLKVHWLEIFIILLPMLALVRLLTVYLPLLSSSPFLTSARLMWIAKFKKMLNIYRSRAFLNRIIRIIVMVDVISYYYSRKNPEKYLQLLQRNLYEKEQELIELKNKINEAKKLLRKEPSD